jgi:hypothetical protein
MFQQCLKIENFDEQKSRKQIRTHCFPVRNVERRSRKNRKRKTPVRKGVQEPDRPGSVDTGHRELLPLDVEDVHALGVDLMKRFARNLRTKIKMVKYNICFCGLFVS